MARFRHPLKLNSVKSEQLAALLSEMPQSKVAGLFGVSQMTVSRHMRRLGLSFDGRARANAGEEKVRKHSEEMKRKYAEGEMIPHWKGKKQSEEIVEKRVSKIRGRPAWNSGKKSSAISTCEICGKEFEHSTNRVRKFCSRNCTAKHMSKEYSDGRYLGNNNPNYGNNSVKEAWKAGSYDNRPIPKHGTGKGGYYREIWMRSSWEIDYAKWLDSRGITWLYESKRFRLKDGRSYTPDFFLVEEGRYIEIKGWWSPQAKEKFSLFLEQYPEIKIEVLENKSWRCQR